MHREVLSKIHQGHQGIKRCLLRARCSVWWPGITHHIKQLVQGCPVCARITQPQKEPLIPTTFPWHTVATDLFELHSTSYLLVIDYFSRFPEITRPTNTTSAAAIEAMKDVFARHGIPELVRSDNGPQYSSSEFASFAREYGFHHVTSSLYYPQSNGQAERGVKTAKRLISSASDRFIVLLIHPITMVQS